MCASPSRWASSCRSRSAARRSARSARTTARREPEGAELAAIASLGTPAELIRLKRDGGVFSAEEIGAVVSGIVDGSMSDAQVAAFAMAVYFSGMTWDESVALTRAMAGSGIVLDWSRAGLDGPILDKHSTGGVGDTVSLILAPVVAACGAFVPMISGRGLGHTGGTLDKLASIPGYDTAPDLARFRATVKEVGCAIVGQTTELAPADRRLYAIRDVTATVDSIPLITASILSKKLAAGLDALVMDVKVGSGAFAGSIESAQALAESLVTVSRDAGLRTVAWLTDMNQALGHDVGCALVMDVKVGSGAFAGSIESALALAESLVTVSRDAGLRTVAWLTDMNQALGHDVGCALEAREAIDFLTGRRRETRLHAVTTALAREMLVLGGLAADHAAAAGPVERALDSGAAAERFARMVAALGGPGDLLERPDHHLEMAPIRFPVVPDRDGIVQRVDARLLGLVVVALGGGRRRAEDTVDLAVGLADLQGPGDPVGADRPLAVVHARSMAAAIEAATAVQAAMVVGDEPAAPPGPPVLRRIGPME